MSLINKVFTFEDDWSDDKKRKSYLLTFINLVLVIFLFLIILIRIVSGMFFDLPSSMESLLLLFALLSMFIFMLFLIKKGFVKLVSIFIISALTACLFKGNFGWGIDLYVVDIFYPLIILLSGLLVGSTFSFFMVVIVSIYLTSIYFLGYELNYIHFLSWRDSNPSLFNLLTILIIYLLMAFASWISSREIEKSLIKIKSISNKLKLQNKNLEKTVKNRTKELRNIQLEKLTQLSPLIDLGKLTAGLVHDIRQPLSVLNILMESAELNENKVDDIKEAFIAINKINEITKACSCRLFSNSELEVFNLNYELEKIVNLFEYKARSAKVKIYLNISQSYDLYADRVKLNQVLANILMNAIESYEDLKKEGKSVFIKFEKKERNLLIKIKDYGIGISENNLKSIFNPNFSLKNGGSSLGIGLYISNEMMEKAYETKIKVESKYNHGSTFIVYIKNKFILDPSKK